MNQGMLVKTAGLGFAVTPNDPSGWHSSLAFPKHEATWIFLPPTPI